MNNIEFDEYEKKLDEVLNKIKLLLISKHRDYGSENLLRYGRLGVLVRLSDKISRLHNLIFEKKEISVKSETIEDTFLDIAGYSIQSMVLFK
jgi:hypothetical protein